MRLAALLALVLSSCAGSCDTFNLPRAESVGGLGGTDGIDTNVKPGGSCAPLPDVFVWQFDADDIDGANNSTLSNGELITVWNNDGGSDADDADIGIDGNDGYKPTFAEATINGHDAVSFDGVAKHRQISTSTSSAAFVHETGDFHFVFVMRPDVTTIDFKTLAANTETSGTVGFIIWLTAAQKVRTLVARAVGGTFAFDYTSTFTLTTGQWVTVEVAADSNPGAPSGTLSVAKNFGTFETQALLNTFGAGAAPNDLAIGITPPVANFPFDGAMALVLIADRKLTTQERADVQAVVSCRYGI